MKITLWEPAEAVTKKGSYHFYAKTNGDQLYFPHVDTCCGLVAFCANGIVGGHIPQQWGAAAGIDLDANATAVMHVMHGLKTNNGLGNYVRFAVIGPMGGVGDDWGTVVKAKIWQNWDDTYALPIRCVNTSGVGNGVNITATVGVNQVQVEDCAGNVATQQIAVANGTVTFQ